MRKVIALRPWLVLVTSGLFIATTIAVVGSVVWNWRFGLHARDKIVTVNTVVAVGAYILVALALLVALAAYISATGKPDLSAFVRFNFCLPNQLVFKAASKNNWVDNWRTVEPFKQVDGEIAIQNNSPYAAQNPGVRITLDGLGGIPPLQGWTVIQTANMVGITTFQWDGGSDYIIHGRWSRTLPRLNVTGMFAYREDPAFIVDVAADGFGPKRTRLPVQILGEDDYSKYTSDRKAEYDKSKELNKVPRPWRRYLGLPLRSHSAPHRT